MSSRETKAATLYRMATGRHVCPFGLKALDLLRRHGFAVEDHELTSRAEVEAFKERQQVTSTPQVFIGGERIGGYEALRKRLGLPVADPNARTYAPVVAVFGLAAAMALAASSAASGNALTVQAAEWFVAFSMCVLAVLKLQNVESFTNTFLGYDLLARRFVPYAYFYPFAEAAAGVLMISGALMWAAIPLSLFIGTIGAASVFKAVYLDKRDLKCACAGGGANVPLGFVSLTENLMMVAMAVWMMAK